jgi:membrane protease YdiL (CAAX protease family)
MTMMSFMEASAAAPDDHATPSHGEDGAQRQPTGPVPSGPTSWPVWTAPAALVTGLVLALFGGLLVDIPAAIFGVSISSSHVPPGLEIADTVVQDAGFVLAAVIFAQMGGRKLGAWQFGLRPTPLRRAFWLVVLTLAGFFAFSFVWAAALESNEKEKLLETLGTSHNTTLLLLSAALTCVVAPICEEMLFRGYIFSALCNWRGLWPAAVITGLIFGGVHVGSAPVVDLAPLAALGFGLCLLYRATGSLYPGIALHSVNNSIAFGALEHWGWQIPVLLLSALAIIALLALLLRRVGVIGEEPVVVPAT